MKFGMILLLLVLACSFAGSIITQGNAEDYYLSTYPDWGNLLLRMGLDRIFSSWYFIALIALLCVNLVFCSILRLGTTNKTFRAMPLSTAKAETEKSTGSAEATLIYVKAHGFRLMETEDGEVWAKNRVGHYGSFLVHLSLLLLLLCASAVLFLSATKDVTIQVGGSAALDDGTEIHLLSFRSADEDGTVDYVSELTVRSAEGLSASGEVSVNHPFSAVGRKFYQYDYGYNGQVEIAYNDQSETMILTAEDEESFFSVDGENGLIYYGLYPDYTLDEEGRAELVTDNTNGYPNPIYAVSLLEGGEESIGLAPPGETLTAGGILFTFGDPVDYSVIRVKTYPAGALALLYCSFALMILGLWLCFFQIPVYIKIDSNGCAVRSTKPTADLTLRLKSREKEGTVGRHA